MKLLIMNVTNLSTDFTPAEATGAPVEQSFKTLVMQGKSKQYYVFVLPIAEEVDLKVAAKTVGENP